MSRRAGRTPPGPVAIVFHDGEVSGATRTLVRVLPELRDRGWDLRFYVDRPSPLAAALEELGFVVDGRPRHVGFSLRWLRHDPGAAVKSKAMATYLGGLASWLRRTRPALVHANSLYSLPDATVARALRIPVFLQLLEMLPEGRKGMVARRAIRGLGIVPGGVSEANARRFAGPDAPLPPIVRTGVPIPERVAQRPPAPAPFVVGSMGWVSQRKGSDVFVKAARLIRERRDDVAFRLVGPVPAGPLEAPGRAIVREAESVGVTWVPFAETYAELAGWDVAVMASRFDPYPLAVMEAMAAGVPVVGARVDGIVEQVLPGTGLLAAPDDPVAIAARVTELLDDAALRRRLGQAARESALARFGLDAQTDALEAVWKHTAAGARA